MFILMCTILYSFACTGSESALVRRLSNTAVVQGSAVTFQCSSDDNSSYIPWYNSTCVTNNDPIQCTSDLIYSGFQPAVLPRFSVTAANNATHVTRDLHINPVQLTDAGVYFCAERRAGVADIAESASAQLVVLANNLSCSASEAVQENDVITMTCTITYSGNWAPVMRWFSSSHNFTDDDITLTTSDTMVTSQLTVTTSDGLHGSQITCVTYFTQPSSPLQTSATNIPSYTYTWTSPKVDVQFAPRNLQITPIIYHPGDRIQCSAEGNPVPSYQWRDLVSGAVIQGDVLDISKDMADRSYSFLCIAINKYNSISSGLKFTVKGVHDELVSSAYRSATIALAVIAIISIVIIILLIIYILRKPLTKDTPVSGEDRNRTTEAGSTSDYSQLNMTSLSANVPYESIQPTYLQAQ